MKPVEEDIAESMGGILPLPSLSRPFWPPSVSLQPLPGFVPHHSHPQVRPQPLCSPAGGGEVRRLKLQPFSLRQQAQSPRRPWWRLRGAGPTPSLSGFWPAPPGLGKRNARHAGYKRQGLRRKSASARADWVSRGRRWVELGAPPQPQLRDDHYSSLLSSRRHRRLYHGTGCMIRPQSLMSKLSPSCGVLGHAFMEFLKGPGEYRQAQHDLYEDKWTLEIRCYSTKKPP